MESKEATKRSSELHFVLEKLVAIHSDMNHNMHNMPGMPVSDPTGSIGQQRFLPWHRVYLYVLEQRRQQPDYQPPVPPVFGEREGRIARANRGRDPLYLFAALQRQLGYPQVPRPTPPDSFSPALMRQI